MNQFIHDVVGAVITGDLSSPYKSKEWSFYFDGDSLDVYTGRTLISQLSPNKGGIVGDITDVVLKPRERLNAEVLADVFDVDLNVDSISPVTVAAIHKVVQNYTRRYDYKSVLSSFYGYVDQAGISDDYESALGEWLSNEGNPLIYNVINKFDWTDKLLSDIEKLSR